MFRIRRRFAILLCFVCMLIFLTLYVIINYAAPNADKKPTLDVFESKMLKLENIIEPGSQDNGKFEIKLKNVLHDQVAVLKKAFKKPLTKTKNIILHTENVTEKCSADVSRVPQSDLQMLDLYDKMSFADIDGGVWKQGWNIKYDPLQYNDHNKLKVFVVPHSHNDPGWIKTFEDYYEHDTKHILSNALRHLRENPDMKFIWAEISYFARFYEDLGQSHKNEMKKLVKNNQLEFVTGGWVMPDEANSHWYSVIMQLTEGQTWLKKYFNVTPSSSWSIDPFGHSPTLPYILQKSGFKNLLIQRTHYSVKKELALHRNLEFYWRQLWDDSGKNDLFTHMMPFYSYDIPHTCGPDPKICCQFDFKRMQGFGLSCPWRVAPQPINDYNVGSRATMIVDQWKKKAELYRTSVVLIPLGDDFRYSQSTEWDVQRVNYEKLFEHINSVREFFTEAKFGTLQEYFDAVKLETKAEFPTLSGDFFTYADRTDNYWSGYYTSRPYHKRMDRVLLHYVRSAEMMSSWCKWLPTANIQSKLENARRQLSLFQHHDGITGTAKTHVVEDYESRLLSAIKDCHYVMQQSAYYLLTNPTIYNADYSFNYFYLDDSRWPGPDDIRVTIILAEELPNKFVAFHNSLSVWREELVDFYVSRPFISVRDTNGNPVQAQVTPVWTWHRHSASKTVTPQGSTTKYRLIFKVRVPPLGMATYLIHAEPTESKPPYTSFASNLILTKSPISINLGDYPDDVKFIDHEETSLKVGNGPSVSFTREGFMKSVQINNSLPSTPVKLSFWKYGTRITGDRSGAYLFLPNGPATPLINIQPPVVLVTKGVLESSVSVGLPFAIHHTILNGDVIEIRNLINITHMDDSELVMRFSTNIESGDTFYTDLNVLQRIKRKRFSKLPLQANYYPVPSTIYIEDANTRLNLMTAQPLGGTSLAQGELEIMQDRRLTMDDERGLGQGVLDNKPVLHIFRILLEKIDTCNSPAENYPGGVLTLAAYRTLSTMLHPVDKFIFTENDWLGVQKDFGEARVSTPEDLEVIVLRDLQNTNEFNLVHGSKKDSQMKTGIIMHRTQLLECSGSSVSNGTVKLKNLLQIGENMSNIFRTTLTFLQYENQLLDDTINLCPMDTQSFIVEYNR